MRNNNSILTTNEAIAQYCPNAKTLREICGDDIQRLDDLCIQMNCEPDDVMIGIAEMMTLVNFAPISAANKLKYRKALSDLSLKNRG